ncbi:MAG: hypothetical protein WEE89_17320 [Gemmatimonadota bacterium]
MRDRLNTPSWRALAASAVTAAVLPACSGNPGSSAPTASPVTIVAQDTIATMNDPRATLTAGTKNTAGIAAKNMQLVSFTPKPPQFDSVRRLTYVNSDLAFRGNYVYQGNFSGFSIWDVSNPASPKLMSTMVCATDQGDPSIIGNLLFISAENGRSRTDCGTQGVQNPKDRALGVRIFDVSDPRNPKLIKNIQNCRGSHTHTIVPHPTDRNTVYIYVGGGGGLRDTTELASCAGYPAQRIDIIRVPLNNPQQAAPIGYARIFDNLPRSPGSGGVARDTTAAPTAGRGGRGGRGGAGPSGCHDLTSYPAFNIVAGSCGSFGILLDIKDPEKPVRLDAKSDLNFSLWHTAVFSNDGKRVVYTDEWGGGTAPRCRITDPLRLGGNTILSINNNGLMTQHGYFKMLAAQTATENCVSHNGGLVPVPGRDIMVQGWYQGGVNVFDFTDPTRPYEIAYFDRGPVRADSLVVGGSWGAYYWNGYVYSSELSRGLDIFELQPSEFLSQNELDAAKLVRMEEYNPQSQPKITWPAAFPVVRSYLDQLVRNQGLAGARTSAIASALTAAERASGGARQDQLNRLATQLDQDASGAADAARVRAMAAAVRDLAAASR